MKKRITNILAIFAIFGYMIFIGRSSYMFSYLAHQNFFYVWVVIAVLWLLKEDKWAKWMTSVSIFAVFPAEIVDWAIRKSGDVEKANLWGVIVWVALVVITLILCIVFWYRGWKEDHPSKSRGRSKTREASDEDAPEV